MRIIFSLLLVLGRAASRLTQQHLRASSGGGRNQETSVLRPSSPTDFQNLVQKQLGVYGCLRMTSFGQSQIEKEMKNTLQKSKAPKVLHTPDDDYEEEGDFASKVRKRIEEKTEKALIDLKRVLLSNEQTFEEKFDQIKSQRKKKTKNLVLKALESFVASSLNEFNAYPNLLSPNAIDNYLQKNHHFGFDLVFVAVPYQEAPKQYLGLAQEAIVVFTNSIDTQNNEELVSKFENNPILASKEWNVQKLDFSESQLQQEKKSVSVYSVKIPFASIPNAEEISRGAMPNTKWDELITEPLGLPKCAEDAPLWEIHAHRNPINDKEGIKLSEEYAPSFKVTRQSSKINGQSHR